ncbi:MAG: NAD(P)H-dependent oxidoreductase, partial [Rhodospirillales bacterium]|nr:NAD(P)H-dependent oxidoreductase [Rhodospirillales bacterium]
MIPILHLTVSPRGENSLSRAISAEAVHLLTARIPDARVMTRDLAREPLPHVDAGFAAAIAVPERRYEQPHMGALALSDTLIDELAAARAVVIGTSVHNYGLPSVLKAWFDHVVRIHRSFRGTPEGKIGLLADRPVLVVAGSGGYFSREPARQPDFFAPHLLALFATIGIRDVTILRLEGLTRGPAAVAAAR